MVDGNSDPSMNDHPKPAPEKPISFVPDIQLMMYGLGDCSKPLEESAELIERIVMEQMALLLTQTREAMHLRGGGVMSPEDVLFLLRRNKAALKRFITYMGVKDEKQELNVMMKEIPDQENEDYQPQEELVWEKGRKEYCLGKLAKYGILEEDILSLTDVIKEERTARACKISLGLTPREYQEFHTARCRSFLQANKPPTFFSTWLERRVKCKDEIVPALLEILIYMAKETIASLIDMILTIREENGGAWLNSSPITVQEIQEAIRRHTSQQSLSFAPFSRDLSSTIHVRLIAF